MAAQLKAAGADVQGMFSNDIVGSSTADDGTRDPRTVRLFAEGVPTSETPAQATIRQSRRRRERLDRRASSPASCRTSRRTTPPACDVRMIYRRDRYLRGSDHIPFLQQGYPAARFTEPHENFAHQHQDVRVENGVQFGDLPEFCDFDYIARVARVNAGDPVVAGPGPGHAGRRADPHRPR